ncbi:MAG: SPOR domain-containing protein [Qipengyuania sp.]|nr:SPOR domain-containing protein [Qipengyuania sp.]
MKSVAISIRTGLLASALAAAAGFGAPAPLGAQEVVQTMPPRETAQLNAALRTLAARPGDLDALLSAGNASLALHDAGAAAGFFARAARVAPGDARVLLGSARVALAQRRPVDALRGFAQAESAGARPLDIAADRALAYDLVGENTSAQALYRSVLAVGDNAEVRRRLALSLAISGNRSEFERTLYPLLRDEDRSAYRTRAFGLAILGLPDDAVEIADAMMPTDLALRMAPYLRYMPRLTKAQQAAAGNLGAFPAATEIGRDSPDIAGYAGAGARIAANANAALTPAGAPLGPRARAAGAGTPGAERRRRDREGDSAAAATPHPTPAAASVRLARVEAPAAPPAPPPVVVAARPASIATPTPTPAPQPARPSLTEAFADFGAAPASSAPAAAVDIARLAGARPPALAPTLKSPAKPAAKPAAKPKPEVRKPAKPTEPARVWIQLGVGRNTAAFAFDWKKLARQAGGVLDGKGPWAARYGATNRMLAGPFPSDAAAKAAIKRLKDKDIDALPFSSDEGEKVTKIG